MTRQLISRNSEKSIMLKTNQLFVDIKIKKLLWQKNWTTNKDLSLG